MSKQAIIILVAGVLILGGIGLTVFLLGQEQDPRSGAQTLPTPTQSLASFTPTPTTAQQSLNNNCPEPSQITNVLVEYPGCVGDTCEFTRATCTWDPSLDATSYNLTVTEVETGTVVRSESAPADTSNVLFNINQGFTYRCEVSAVSACGAVSLASSHELLCETDALIPTATPTIPVVTSPPTVPPTEMATATPLPPIEKPGGLVETVAIFGGITVLILAGILLIAL